MWGSGVDNFPLMINDWENVLEVSLSSAVEDVRPPSTLASREVGIGASNRKSAKVILKNTSKLLRPSPASRGPGVKTPPNRYRTPQNRIKCNHASLGTIVEESFVGSFVAYS